MSATSTEPARNVPFPLTGVRLPRLVVSPEYVATQRLATARSELADAERDENHASEALNYAIQRLERCAREVREAERQVRELPPKDDAP